MDGCQHPCPHATFPLCSDGLVTLSWSIIGLNKTHCFFPSSWNGPASRRRTNATPAARPIGSSYHRAFRDLGKIGHHPLVINLSSFRSCVSSKGCTTHCQTSSGLVRCTFFIDMMQGNVYLPNQAPSRYTNKS